MTVIFEAPSYKIVNRLPTLPEYQAIKQSRQQTQYLSESVIQTALQHSLYGVIAESNHQVVGMGRIIGDSATLFMIQDVLVMPSSTEVSIELALIDALILYLEETAPNGAVVASLPTVSHTSLFEQLGFKPVCPDATAVFRLIDRLHPDDQFLPWK